MSRPVWLGQEARGWDHIRLHISLLDHPDTDPYDIAVYAVLAKHAESGSGETRPAQDTIAAAAKCSRGRVRASIDKLVTLGYIEAVGGKGAPLIYRLLPPPRVVPQEYNLGRPTPADLPVGDGQVVFDVDKSCTPRVHEPDTDLLNPVVVVPTDSESQADLDIPQDSQTINTCARPDVERLCLRLQQRVTEAGHPRPNVTKGWRDAARLMLDRDGHTETQVAAAIDWATNHEFWRMNIRSMPTLRAQYSRLQMQATYERRKPKSILDPIDRGLAAIKEAKRQQEAGRQPGNSFDNGRVIEHDRG